MSRICRHAGQQGIVGANHASSLKTAKATYSCASVVASSCLPMRLSLLTFVVYSGGIGDARSTEGRSTKILRFVDGLTSASAAVDTTGVRFGGAGPDIFHLSIGRCRASRQGRVHCCRMIKQQFIKEMRTKTVNDAGGFWVGQRSDGLEGCIGKKWRVLRP